MSDVLINFKVQDQTIDQAAGKLDQLTEAEKRVADQAKVTYAEIEKGQNKAAESVDRLTKKEKEYGNMVMGGSKGKYAELNKELDQVEKKATSSLDTLSKKTKDLDKTIIGGAYAQNISKLKDEIVNFSTQGAAGAEKLSGLLDELLNKQDLLRQAINNATNPELIEQYNKGLADTNKEIAMVSNALDNLQSSGAVFDEFKTKEDDATQSTVAFRTEIREAEMALKQMYDAGLAGTPAFDEQKQVVADLKNEYKTLQKELTVLGSGTKNIEGLISLTSGLAGGFAAIQGAAALFGDESEEVQEALLKVNAAMSILMGLQQLNNVLLKESAAMTLLNTVRTTAQTVATNIQTAATGAGTIATRALNVVLAASPIGLFIAGITAAIAVLNSFSRSADEAKRSIEELNDEAEDYYTLYTKISKTNPASISRNIEIKKNEETIKTYEAMGGKLEEVNKLRNRNLQLEKQNLNVQLNGLNSARKRAGDQSLFTERELELKGELYEKDQEVVRNNIKLGKDQASADKDAADKRKKAAEEATSARKKAADEALKNNKQVVRERIAGFEAELSALKAADRDEEVIYIQKRKAAIDANAELSLLEVKGIEQRRAVLAKAEEDKAAIENEYQERQTARQYELDKRNIDARLSAVKQGSIEELEIRKEAIDRDSINEQLAIANTIKNEEELRAARADIRAKAAADIKKLEDEFAKDRLKNSAEVKAIKIEGKILEKERMLIGQKNKAIISQINREILNDRMFAVSEEMALNEDLYERGLISEEEYLKQKLSLRNKYREIENEGEQQAFNDQEEIRRSYVERLRGSVNTTLDSMKEMLAATSDGTSALADTIDGVQRVFNTFMQETATTAQKVAAVVSAAQQSINSVFQEAAEQRQMELDAKLTSLDEARERELAVQNLTEQQKADIDKKYRAREAQAKRQAFEADKRAKISQAIINTALAVINALATAPWPYNIALAAAAGITGGVQIAKISSQQAPKFKKGKIKIQGPGTDTSDSIPAMISKNESVINARATKKWEGALTAINNDTFDSWLDKRFRDFSYPEVPPVTYKGFEDSKNRNIDYDKLGNAIAKRIPEPTYIQNNFDEGGFHRWVSSNGNRTEYKNKRYSMN